MINTFFLEGGGNFCQGVQAPGYGPVEESR